VRTHLDPHGLLDACKEVERVLGRRVAVRHGPRTIDVDVLLLGMREHVSERLSLPHADLLTRRFVLAPLLELDPAVVVPGYGPAAAALAALAPGQEVRRAGPPLETPYPRG
jgi:2-amino-4-hydroxy-6-hydroxymethyldihydropteridine diphosphokinase